MINILDVGLYLVVDFALISPAVMCAQPYLRGVK